MSICAFCGERRTRGRSYLAHRMTPSRVRTVRVCAHCVGNAIDAGYYVTESAAPPTIGRPRRPSLSKTRYQ